MADDASAASSCARVPEHRIASHRNARIRESLVLDHLSVSKLHSPEMGLVQNTEARDDLGTKTSDASDDLGIEVSDDLGIVNCGPRPAKSAAKSVAGVATSGPREVQESAC